MSSPEKRVSFFDIAVAAIIASGILSLYFFLISIVVFLMSSVMLVIKQSCKSEINVISSPGAAVGHDKSSISVINEIRIRFFLNDILTIFIAGKEPDDYIGINNYSFYHHASVFGFRLYLCHQILSFRNTLRHQ